MKTTKPFFVALVLSLLLFSSTTVLAQETSKYITVTTLHWNMDLEDFDMDIWKSVEKEYLEKVTSQNEYILGSSFYLHEFTPDNTELIYVGVYESWEFNDEQGWLDLAGCDETFLQRVLESEPYTSIFCFLGDQFHLLEDSTGSQSISLNYHIIESTSEYLVYLFKGPDAEAGEDCYQYKSVFFNEDYVTAEHNWDRPTNPPRIRSLWNKIDPVGVRHK